MNCFSFTQLENPPEEGAGRDVAIFCVQQIQSSLLAAMTVLGLSLSFSQKYVPCCLFQAKFFGTHKKNLFHLRF
jgi:hypothetical protein